MKKPYLLILMAVLLLGLLVPVIYHGGGGGQPQQQAQDNTATDPGNRTGGGAAADKQGVLSRPAKQGSPMVGPSPGGSAQEAAKENALARSTNGPLVSAAVIGKDGGLLFGPANLSIATAGAHDASALDALEATGLKYVMSTRFPDLVISVAGQQNQGQSGWMYEVNDAIPSVAAAKKTVGPGDRVIWWYSRSLDTPAPSWNSLKKLK